MKEEKNKKKQNKYNSKKRIDQLEKCIRNKDKRIKKIEEYFKLRNKLILSSIITIVCAVPIIWIVSIFGRIMDHRDLITIDERGIMLIGCITTIIVPVVIWSFSIVIIWEKG